MGKVHTTVLVDIKLKEEAKKMNIPLGKTLEDGLKEQINKDRLIEDLKAERTEFLRQARELKFKIEKLEKRKKKEIEVLGKESERMEKALVQLQGILDRIGDVSDEQIRWVAGQKHVPYIELSEKFKAEIAKIAEQNGEVFDDPEY